MISPALESTAIVADLTADVCQRAVRSRDPRFDGVFFVAITTTGVYCRPVCPARVTHPEHRRFFGSAAAAERAGYRPCLRCRPELAPGRALCDAVSRLAGAAACRIAAGALNGRSVAELARELCVSERHLRRALERELGVSPIDLAQTHRLLLAKRLLADTDLPISRIAFASGFQSLRRFNTVFRERYRMAPTALRRKPRASDAGEGSDLLRLTLAYRPPFAWDELLTVLRRESIPGVELVEGRRYVRTVRLGPVSGVIVAEDARLPEQNGRSEGNGVASRNTHVHIDISPTLVPALMPLLARLRQLLDLDAEPSVIDAHLEQGGLSAFVRALPGLRVRGAFDGFEVALRVLLGERANPGEPSKPLLRRVVTVVGEPITTGSPSLNRLAPSAERVADARPPGLAALGIPHRRADAIVNIARHVAEGSLRLEPGSDVAATCNALCDIADVDHAAATAIATRALSWPDAFPAEDPRLQRAAGTSSAGALLQRAEAWRPWRAYAAMHLRLPSGLVTRRHSGS